MIHEIIPVGKLACNCSIIGDELTREALVIDPGDEVDQIVKILKKHRLQATQIIATHAHIDHVGGVDDLKKICKIPVLLHEDDFFLYQNLAMQADWLGVESPCVSKIDRFVREGQSIKCGALSFDVLHTPGHSPGSISLYHKGKDELLFSGDTLFEGSVGRTDLWGGSIDALLLSIKERLLIFNDPTKVFPGHGSQTTIGYEREHNPFLAKL